MTITGAAMLLLPTMPDREAFRLAAAGAYGVPAREVSIGVYRWDANPFPLGRRVYINLWNDESEPVAGDLPFIFDQELDDTLIANFDAKVQRMAELLGMMIVTNDHEADPAIIHLPDGTTVRRKLEELPEGGLLLPPDLKAIAVAGREARAA